MFWDTISLVLSSENPILFFFLSLGLSMRYGCDFFEGTADGGKWGECWDYCPKERDISGPWGAIDDSFNKRLDFSFKDPFLSSSICFSERSGYWIDK